MTLALTESGPGGADTVVLLHGVGTSGWMWRRLAADLAGDLHVLVVDLPGHGCSNHLTWVSLTDTVTAVAEVIETRGSGGRASVVGLSLGGYVAAELAAGRPDIVPAAVLSGVNVLPFPRPGLMRVAGRLMAPFMASGPMLRANARSLGVPPEDFADYAAAARAMAPGTFLRVGGELMDYRLPGDAAGSPCRVLAVAGEREQDLILRSLPVIAQSFPAGTARTAPGAGHAWNGEAPDLFAATVRAHITGGPLPEELRIHDPA